MEDSKIFDRNGKELHIADVISRLFTELEDKYPKYDRITIQSLDKIYAIGHTEIEYESDDEKILCSINDMKKNMKQLNKIVISPIIIKKYETELVEHFFNGESIGFLNDAENLHLRCEIKEQGIIGYSLRFNGIFHNIDITGCIIDYPQDLYDVNRKLLNKFFNI